jgi:ATP-binding protein involved in chromosome partitioning
MGSLVPESEALDFESVADGESHTWRATREFALLAEILESFEWGALDLLMVDLPPGAERTVQYADALGPRTSFLLVTIPSEVARGVVARSVAALSKGPNRLLGYVENMSGYYCRDCDAIKPLFDSGAARAPGAKPPGGFSSARSAPAGAERGEGAPLSRMHDGVGGSAGAKPPGLILSIPCLGTVPFDPELARQCDDGMSSASLAETPVGRALEQVAQQLLNRLDNDTERAR